jgi:hypothetical protein
LQGRGRPADEIKPDYSTLLMTTIVPIKRLDPNLRIVFSMHDSIDRGWSQVWEDLPRVSGVGDTGDKRHASGQGAIVCATFQLLSDTQ